MKKSTTFLVIIMTFVLVLTCVGCTDSNNTKSETVQIVDMVGDTVIVPKNPKKVACVSRTTYDLLIAYGLGDCIDGAYEGTLNNPWVQIIYPEAKDHYIYGYNDSYETFVVRGVELVLAPEQYIAEGLREHGINAITVSLYGNPTFDNYVTYFSDLVTQIWDSAEVKEKAELWNNRVETAIEEIQTELAKHDVEEKILFYVRGDKDNGIGYTDMVGSFTEYAYRVLGFDYVGTTLETNKPSQEEVMAANPDVFVCGGIYQNINIELLKQEPYSKLDAVKNNQIFNIPIGLTAFEQLSAMTPIFFYDQANKIYPEYFDYDIPTMVEATINEYFGTTLTDTQVSYMLQGLDAEGNSLVR